MITANPERCHSNIIGEVSHELSIAFFIALIFIIGVVTAWPDLTCILLYSCKRSLALEENNESPEMNTEFAQM